MKVWVLMVNRWDGGDDDRGSDSVVDVFSTEEAAENAKKTAEAEQSTQWDSPRFTVTGPFDIISG